MFSVENILDKLIEKSNKVNSDLIKLKQNNWSNINSSSDLMNELSKISTSMINLETSLVDINDLILENTINPNREELRKLKQIKINKFIEKKFFPLIIYLRLCIENNIVDID